MDCGECTVCCTLSVVKELDKKVGEQCVHCVDQGCMIHGKHPKVCKDFECAYYQGGNNIKLRPDQCGIMFWKKNERLFSGMVMPGLEITEMAKGQIESFKKQGYSVMLLKLGEVPHLELAEGHDKEEMYKEYVNTLTDGNI